MRLKCVHEFRFRITAHHPNDGIEGASLMVDRKTGDVVIYDVEYIEDDPRNWDDETQGDTQAEELWDVTGASFRVYDDQGRTVNSDYIANLNEED